MDTLKKYIFRLQVRYKERIQGKYSDDTSTIPKLVVDAYLYLGRGCK